MMAIPARLYEVLDTTDEETYYTMGIFITLEDAMSIKDIPPDDWRTDGSHDEAATVEIREREVGWSGNGKAVWSQSWVNHYDAASDECKWFHQPPAAKGGE